MADSYNTIQQHQPLRVPQGWDKQEKALIVQLDEIFDDIYRRFGRLRLEDMSRSFRKEFADAEGNIAELVLDVSGLSTRVGTAEGNISTLTLDVSGLTTRVGTAEGNISTLTLDVSGLTTRVGTAEGNIGSLSLRCDGFDVSIGNKYDKVSGIAITTDGIDVTGSRYVKIRSGGTFDVDATNFKISSQDKKLVTGDWTFNEEGASYNYTENSRVYPFKICDRSNIPSSNEQGAGIAFEYDSANAKTNLEFYIKRTTWTPVKLIFSAQEYNGTYWGELYPSIDGGIDLGLASRTFDEGYINHIVAQDFTGGRLWYLDAAYAANPIDLNDFTDAGYYMIEVTNMDYITNVPSGLQPGSFSRIHIELEVNHGEKGTISENRTVVQRIYMEDCIYMRRKLLNSSGYLAWSSWKKFISVTAGGGFTYGQLSGR